MSPGGSADRVGRTLAMLGGRWKLALVFHLFAAPSLRFHELQKSLRGISHRMLTLRLRELERDGVIDRRVLRPKPLEVAYALTPRGHALQPLLRGLRNWSQE